MPNLFQWQGSLCRARHRHVADGQMITASRLHFDRGDFEASCIDTVDGHGDDYGRPRKLGYYLRLFT